MGFIEQSCTVEHNGQTFESGGAFLGDCTDGYMRGVVYADPDNHRVTTWHGETIARAEFGKVYRGNFSKMQSVSFTVEGIRYTGRYCPDCARMIRVRSTKRITTGE